MKKATINPIDAALAATGGTQAQLARAIGVTPAVVTAWKTRAKAPEKSV